VMDHQTLRMLLFVIGRLNYSLTSLVYIALRTIHSLMQLVSDPEPEP
jgi:hypothetical protein